MGKQIVLFLVFVLTCKLGIATTKVRSHDLDWGTMILELFTEQTPWRIFYADAAGAVTELTLGDAGEYLGSAGTAAVPVWSTPSGTGEVNTASNVGTLGQGLFKQKIGVDLEFYKVASSNARLTVTLVDTDYLKLTVDPDLHNYSWGNVVAGDIPDAYILNTGDTASGDYTFSGNLEATGGRILTSWSHTDDGTPNIDVQNFNGLNTIARTAATYAIWSGVTSDTAEEKYALRAAAGGDGGDKYAVYGSAEDGGGTNYGIYGIATGATTNWAGYFAAGNVYVADNIHVSGTVDGVDIAQLKTEADADWDEIGDLPAAITLDTEWDTWEELPAMSADVIKNTHIDWGIGTNQVCTDNMPEGFSNLYSTLANIQTATTSDFHNIGGVDDDLPDADEVTEAMLKAVDTAADEDICTYENITGDFEWHTPAELVAAGTLISWTGTTLNVDSDLHNYSWGNVIDGDIPDTITIGAGGSVNDAAIPAGITRDAELAAWTGTTNITTLGTIGTGTWNATAISNTKGGTGQDSSAWTGFAKVAAGIWSATVLADGDIPAGITRDAEVPGLETDSGHDQISELTATWGDGLTRTGDTVDVDDNYLLNTGDAATGAYTFDGTVASTYHFHAPLFRNTGNISIDAMNAGADSTVTVTNSSPTYIASLVVEGGITANGRSIPEWVNVPISAGALGTAGQMAYDANYLYICVATDTWLRTAISTW